MRYQMLQRNSRAMAQILLQIDQCISQKGDTTSDQAVSDMTDKNAIVMYELGDIGNRFATQLNNVSNIKNAKKHFIVAYACVTKL